MVLPNMCINYHIGESLCMISVTPSTPNKPRDFGVAILLGAVASIPAGYPSTGELTQAVLAGEGVYRHTDGRYYLRESSRPSGCRYVKASREILKALLRILEDKSPNVSGRPPNYEDLIYLLSQLHDHHFGEVDNSALGPFVAATRPVLEAALKRLQDSLASISCDPSN